MKQAWQRVAARIDEMNLRQRAMLFATISLALVFLVHLMLIEPLLVRQKRLIDQSNRDQSQLAAVRAQLQNVLKTQEGDKSDPEQAALQALELRLAEVEKQLAQRKQSFVAPARLPALLRDLLGPGRLKLESLKLMPGAQVDKAAPLYRHGVEMTLSGSYFDLMQYLGELEKMPGQLLWGPVDLQVSKYPEVRLTLQVSTLSTQPSLGL